MQSIISVRTLIVPKIVQADFVGFARRLGEITAQVFFLSFQFISWHDAHRFFNGKNKFDNWVLMDNLKKIVVIELKGYVTSGLVRPVATEFRSPH